MSKYRAEPVIIDGHRFPSKKEARRYLDLNLLLKTGLITGLKLQVPIVCEVRGIVVCKYMADFAYQERLGQKWGPIVYEDTKGFRTPVYRLKKRLVLACTGIEIRET